MTRPGYKRTEIGEIPEEWEVKELDQVSTLKNGLNFKKESKQDKGIPTIDVLNMYGKGLEVDLSRIYKINMKVDEDYLLEQGDILIVRSSLKKEGVGWASLVPKHEGPLTFVGFIIRVKILDTNIIPEFLTYYLRSKFARDYFRNSAGQVAISNINQKTIGALHFPYVPCKEQQKIAEILTTVDRKIELIIKQIEATETLKKGLMQRLLTKGIGHTKFKMTEIGKIPIEWEAVTMSEVGQYINGMAFKPRDWKEQGIPIVRIENLNDLNASFNYYQEEFDKRYILNDGELLLSWSASLGVYLWNRGKALLNQHIFKVIPKENVSKYYLYWALHRAVGTLSRATHGSTMKHFQKGELERTLIPLPPLPEQQKIAKILSDADKEIEVLKQKRDKYKLLKVGMMQQLLTGGIRVK